MFLIFLTRERFLFQLILKIEADLQRRNRDKIHSPCLKISFKPIFMTNLTQDLNRFEAIPCEQQIES